MIGGAKEELLSLARKLQAAELEHQAVEATLKEKAEAVRVLAEELIPQLMEELGMSRFDTSDGTTILLREQVFARVEPERKGEVHDWLEDQGGEHLVKRTVELRFDKGEGTLQRALISRLSQDSDLVQRISTTRKVEPSALTGYVRSLLAQGQEVHEAILLNRVREAVVKGGSFRESGASRQ